MQENTGVGYVAFLFLSFHLEPLESDNAHKFSIWVQFASAPHSLLCVLKTRRFVSYPPPPPTHPNKAEELVFSFPLLVFGYLKRLFGPKSCYKLLQINVQSWRATRRT